MEQKLNGGSSTSFYKHFVVAGSILTVAMIGLSTDYTTSNVIDHSVQLAETENHISADIVLDSSEKLKDADTKNISEDLAHHNSESDLNQENDIKITTKKSTNNKKVIISEKVSTENLSDLEKENLIRINESIKEKSNLKNSPVTEYFGKNFKLDANMTLSPNGDNKNDAFLPDALKAADNFIMKIFDKNGAMVFSSSSLDNPWTGYNQITGEQTENGKYRWKVTLDNNNRREIFTGKIVVKN
jgi:gliding motility-associated-like protein